MKSVISRVSAIAAMSIALLFTAGCGAKSATVTPPTTSAGSISRALQIFDGVVDAALAAITAEEPNLPYLGLVDTCTAAITKEASTADSPATQAVKDGTACSTAISQSGAAGPEGSLIASGITIFLNTLQSTGVVAAPVPAATAAKVAQFHAAVSKAKPAASSPSSPGSPGFKAKTARIAKNTATVIGVGVGLGLVVVGAGGADVKVY